MQEFARAGRRMYHEGMAITVHTPTRLSKSRRWKSGLLLLVFTVLLARLGWTAWRLDTAPDALAAIFQNATVGWIGWERKEVTEMLPAEQADFWLTESKRILAEHPTSELARGAAWMLDSPHASWISLEPTLLDSNLPDGGYKARFEREEPIFDAATNEAVLEAAALATRLAPDDARAWRTRALIVMSDDFPVSAGRGKPRDPDWLEILDEAAAHDPENGLYDYLAAHQLSRESIFYQTTLGPGPGGTRVPTVVKIDVTNAERFAAARSRFERAQQKPFVRGGDGDWKAVEKLLQISRAPTYAHPELLTQRAIDDGLRYCMYDTLRLQARLAASDPPESRLDRYRAGLRMAEQLAAVREQFSVDKAETVNRLTIGFLAALLKEHPELSEPKKEEVLAAGTSAHVHNLVLQHALLEAPPLGFPAALPPLNLWSELAVRWSLPLAVLLGAIAAGALFTTRWLGGGPVTARAWTGVMLRVAAWILGLGMSFTIFGLMPEEVIPAPTQQFLSRMLYLLVPSGVILSVLWWFLSRRKWQFSLLALVLTGPIVAVVLAVAIMVFADEPGFTIPTRPVQPTTMHSIQQVSAIAAAFRSSPEIRMAYQWDAWSGPTIGALLALSIIAGWTWIRAGRGAEPLNWRNRTAITLTVVGQTARNVAILLLFAFLLLAPSYLHRIQQQYDSQMAWLNRIDLRRDGLSERITTLGNDPAIMKEFRDVAQKQLAKELGR